jgi:hypothetical protein
LCALLAAERQHFAADPAAAAQLCAGREGHGEGHGAELAAWSVVTGVVLALDEFVTKS